MNTTMLIHYSGRGKLLNRVILSVIILMSPLYLSGMIPTDTSCGMATVFSDNFNLPDINTAKWNTSYPDGQGELQWYTPDALSVNNNVLTITAEKRKLYWQNFTSGIMTTQGTFKQLYGYFEIRAKVPKGRGFLPAFWLMPASGKWPPEIDVFEILGQEPNKVYMTEHYLDSSGNQAEQQQFFVGPDFSKDFHTYAVDWTPDKITWYVDGVERFSTTQNVPHEPMFLLVNLAVGGNWPGPPDAATVFPSTMEVSYVHVYARSCRY
ncbi:MAG: family 16 glycosylhydrolase [Omnitrophica WOR_2 bacterium]